MMPVQNRGFTLLEVLIAIVITALIGLGSWQLLNSAIRTNELTQKRLDAFKELQRAMLFIKRDLRQLAARASRDEYGDYQPALSTRNQFYPLEFTRTGWRNPLQEQRSDLQRVAYELDGTDLRRYYWTVLDRAHDSAPRSRNLLSNVEEISFRFMNDSGGWSGTWPPEERGNNDSTEATDPMEKHNILPKGVELSLRHAQFGELKMLIDTSLYHANQAFPEAQGNNDGNNNQNPGNGNTNRQNTGSN